MRNHDNFHFVWRCKCGCTMADKEYLSMGTGVRELTRCPGLSGFPCKYLLSGYWRDQIRDYRNG